MKKSVKRIELPSPHAAQRSVLAEARRFNVLACGRRWGKSTLGIDRVVKPMLQGLPALWAAPSFKLLMEIWRTAQTVLAPLVTNKNNAEMRLEIEGGGSLTCFSLDVDVSDSCRGRAFKVAIIDEAALVKNLIGIWENAIRPALSDYRGDAWFLSTPRGIGEFQVLYARGQDSSRSDWASWQMPTSTNPHIAPEEIEAARADMTEAAFSQEYLASFVNWEGSVFRHIHECATVEPGEPRVEGHEYAIGVDWGRSNDYTVMAVVDISARRMVHMDRSNRVDYSLQRARLQGLNDRWRPVRIVAESNSIGQPIIEDLQRNGLPVKAFQTTNASKAVLVEALALAFEQASIEILNDPVLLGELQAFSVEPLPGGMLRYAASAGQHDDTVMALAIGWSAVRSAPRYGLLEYLQGEESRAKEEMASQNANTFAALAGVQPKAPAPAAVSGCPKCGAACIFSQIGGGQRCNQCSHEWGSEWDE